MSLMQRTGRFVTAFIWTSRLLLVATLAAILAVPAGCRQSAVTTVATSTPQEPAWFEDVTEKVGLKFVHDAGPGGEHQLPEIMGSGAAVFDFDGDGLLDLYLIQNGGPKSNVRNQLFRQTPEGKFVDVSAGSGL